MAGPRPGHRCEVGTTGGGSVCTWWLTGAGPLTVVLEGGLGASSLGWSTVADRLGGVARVLRYDRAGLGHTRAVGAPRGLSALAGDLLRVLEAAGTGSPLVLVGHSWGASVVRLLAHRRPDLVAGLVLFEPVPDRWLRRRGPLLAAGGRLVYGCLRVGAATGLIGLLGASGPARRRSVAGRAEAPADERRAGLRAEVRTVAHHRAGQREFHGMAVGSGAELAELAAGQVVSYPVLVVSGQPASRGRRWIRSRLVTAHGELARCYGGRHIVLEGVGHFFPRDPTGLVDVVTALCQDVQRQRAPHGAAGQLPPRDLSAAGGPPWPPTVSVHGASGSAP